MSSPESQGGGKSPERPEAAKLPLTEEDVTARAKEVLKNMKFPVTSPEFEEAFIADYIKRIEDSGQEIVRTKK